MGQSVTISCETNVQNVSSTLWVKKENGPAQQIVPNGKSITRRQNTYVFQSVTLDNAGLYICKATFPGTEKRIEKEVTRLLVFQGENQNCVCVFKYN